MNHGVVFHNAVHIGHIDQIAFVAAEKRTVRQLSLNIPHSARGNYVAAGGMIDQIMAVYLDIIDFGAVDLLNDVFVICKEISPGAPFGYPSE